jgi:radical SAM superfamily enzyme YgiQ (UPF0313 family)
MIKGLIFTGFAQYNISAERPGGAYRIAHCLRQHNFDVEVIDYVLYWRFEEIKELLNSRKDIKFIGISATWIAFDKATEDLVKFIKINYPDIILIIGGNSILNPALTADYFVNGFGESAMMAIMDYEFGTGKKPYGEPFANSWYIDALHLYPSWQSDHYMADYEDRDFLTPTDVVTFEMSRGCRFQCKYCSFPILGVKEDNSVNEEVVYSFIKNMHDRWGITNFEIADETFNDRNSKLEKLARTVQRLDFKPNFNGFVRADLFHSHPEQVDLLIAGRFWGHYYGLETFNHRSGKIVGKGLAPDLLKEIVLNNKKRFSNELGMFRGTIGMIAGLPYETINDLENTYNWLVTNWQDQSWIMWNLSIPKINKNVKPSNLTFDYAKYGYEEMSKDAIEQATKSIVNDEDLNLLPYENPEFFWKNQNGTYFDFFNACRKFDGHASRMSRITNYTVWGRLSLGIPLEQALKESYAEPNNNIHQLFETIIKNYIHKKLSL